MNCFSDPVRRFLWSPPTMFVPGESFKNLWDHRARSFLLLLGFKNRKFCFLKWKLRSRGEKMLEKLVGLLALMELELSRRSPSPVLRLGRAARAGRVPTLPATTWRPASVLLLPNSAGPSARLSFAKAPIPRFVKLNRSPIPVIQSWAKRPPKFPVSLISSSLACFPQTHFDLGFGVLFLTLWTEMEMMKERFSKLLLGEDMSGSGKGVCTALAISNAITNLCGELSLASISETPFSFCFNGFLFCFCATWSYHFWATMEIRTPAKGEKINVEKRDWVASLCEWPHSWIDPLFSNIPRWKQAGGNFYTSGLIDYNV